MSDCKDIHEALRRGVRPAGADTDAHVAACAACNMLLAGGVELGRAMEAARAPLDPARAEDLAALEARLAGERGLRAWLRELSTPVRVLLALFMMTLLALATWRLTPRADLGVYPGLRMLLALGLFAGVAAVTAQQSLRPLHRPGPTPLGGGLFVALALLAAGAFALLPAAHASHPDSLAGVGSDFVPRALGCLAFGALTGVPLLALLWAADRTQHTSLGRALAAAAATGMVANLTLQLHCPITMPLHLVAGHLGAAVTVVAAYAVLRRA